MIRRNTPRSTRWDYLFLHGSGVNPFINLIRDETYLWTPDAITTEGWWDASDASTITESGGSVSQWDDKSGNDRNAAQGIGAQQPAYGVNTQNGLGLVTWDGTNGVGLPVGGSAMAVRDYFIVAKYNSSTFLDNDALFSSDSSGTSIYGQINSTQMLANTPEFGGSFRESRWYMDGAQGSLWQEDIAPLTEFKLFVVDGMDVSATKSDWRIGSTSSGSQSWNGDIAEVIVIKEDTSTADRQKIEGYLAWKWGLQSKLPVDHPYKNSAPVLWTPEIISTEGWWDASDEDTITESGGDVSQLDDKSGNDQHLTQPTGAFQPATGTYTFNGLNMLYYDGGEAMATYGDNFVVPASGNMSIFHVAHVILPLENTADGMFAMLDAGGVDWQFVGGVNVNDWNGRIVANELGGTNTNFSPAMGTGESIYNVEFNFDAGTINGYRTGNAVGGTTYTIKPTSPQTFILMSNRVGNSLLGHGGETIIVEDVTQATREKIEGYLAWKWGLVSQLPADHPFKTSAPTTGGAFGDGFGNGFG